MKKNVLRVISLILVAAMLMAFCSCTQTVLVRFVDANGNDIDLSVLGNAGGGSVPANSQISNSTPAPADNSNATPAPADNSNDTPAPADNSSDTPAPADTPAASTGNKPSSIQEIADFYKAAVKKIKNDGAAGYTKKEWQVVDNINIGPSMINNAVVGVLGNFMTSEEKAEEQVNAKGSDDAKNRFPDFTLTDYSQIASATCDEQGGNYNIKIVMKDEDTPKKSGSVLGQVTNSILYWEDIDDTLKNDSTVNKILTAYDGIHVVYKAYTIEATISTDGNFSSLKHTADVDIIIGSAKILVATIKDKSGHMNNYANYWGFQY